MTLPGHELMANGAKAFDSTVEDSIRRSVMTPEKLGASTPMGPVADGGVLWLVGGYADAIPTWGSSVTQRDMMLRQFLTSEPVAGSAFASIIVRNAAFSWKLKGPEKSKNAAFDLLHRAQWGRGWIEFATRYSMEIMTQDKGAFVEIIRQLDSEFAPVIGFQVLDSACCWVTGDPMTPVIYLDRRSGKYHRLKWYHVWHDLEVPVFHPMIAEIQMCSLSRVLRVAQIFRNVLTYQDEKTGGRHTRAIHVVSGVSQQQLTDAMSQQQTLSDQRLLSRYIQPVIVAMADPKSVANVATLELASMPEGFTIKDEFSLYLTILAMGLTVDFQELAPLPSGNIGTGAQSETLDKKSQRKGAGFLRKKLAHFINAVLMPPNVEFAFDEQDLDEEFKEATNKKLRAEGRAIQQATGEVDPAGARQLALDEGDISEELFAAMNARDLTEEAIREDERTKVAQDMARAGLTTPGVPTAATGGITPAAAVSGRAPVAPPKRDAQQASKDLAAALSRGAKGQELGAFLQTRIHRAFTTAADDLAALGYMDTPGRIRLSGIIGDALGVFSELIDEEAADIAYRWLEDEDVRVMMEKAIAELAGKDVSEDRAGPDETRLRAEDHAAKILEKVLGEVYDNVSGKLTPDDAVKSGETIVHKKIHRDEEGRVIGVIEEHVLPGGKGRDVVYKSVVRDTAGRLVGTTEKRTPVG